jgi:predicted PurR-regulated permease PerM
VNTPALEGEKWFLLAALLLCGWVLYLLAPVLTPFLVGALLAYLGDPVTRRLQRFGLSRTLAVIAVFLFMLLAGVLLLVLLVPLLQQQLLGLAERLPQILDWAQRTLLPRLQGLLGVAPGALEMESLRGALQSHWREVGGAVGALLGTVGASGQALLGWLGFIVLVPVVTFYLLRDWDALLAAIHALIPPRVEPVVVDLARQCDAVLGEFLRGQLLVMLALGVFYTVGLWMAGIEFPLLIGMLAGAISFVPYLGAIIGIGVAGTVAFLEHQDVLHLVYVAIVFGAGQLLEGMVLSPWLVGDRIGLHPVAVIFAILAGGQLFGFFGVLIALPAAAIAVVMLRHVRARYVASSFYTP